ncbi:unnamed protein product, partial [Rotaria magnacalcarata]
MVAFVKRVDLGIPENRITEALTKVGLDAINATRLNRKDGNMPTSTIKITFKDANNRNTFIHTGLQMASMYFNPGAASQNKKSVPCYICLQYNHVAKYCKTQQQICTKCGDNHRIKQCTDVNDAIKCNNCKEQEKRMLNLINQYSSTSSPITTTPLLHDSNEFPSLPNMYQRQQVETLINDDATSSSSFPDSDEDIQIVNNKNKKQSTTTTTKLKKQNNKPTTSSAVTTAKPTTTTNANKHQHNHLSQQMISERPFSLLGYNIFRNDRVGKPGGEVLLAVKEHIKCGKIINKTTHKNEIIAVQIGTLVYKSTLISSIYVAPTAKIDMNIFQELYNINNNWIIVGDLNTTLFEMGSTKTNARGKQPQKLLNEGIIECVDDNSTTFEKDGYEAKLYWILGSQPLRSSITNVETHPTIGTINGHKQLAFDIQIGVEPKPTSPRLSLNFKAAKWTKFRSKLGQQLMLWNNETSLNAALNIEEHSTFTTNSIMLATHEVLPTSTPTSKSYTLSEASTSLSGTPQGSPLSPLLYIIYTADSMNDIPPHTEHGLFADDTTLWT